MDTLFNPTTHGKLISKAIKAEAAIIRIRQLVADLRQSDLHPKVKREIEVILNDKIKAYATTGIKFQAQADDEWSKPTA